MRVFSLCTFVRFETMIWPSIRFDISSQNFKKPLDSFSPQIERKRSKEYLVIILPVKESFERFSCLEFVFEKSKHREAGLKHKLKLEAWSFNAFLPEWKLLSLYVFYRTIFLLSIVSSLSCNFNRCADCFQSFSEHRSQEYSKCRAMLERNSVNFMQTLATARTTKVRTGWPYRWFWKFFLTV